jgi:plasmid stabilization system protein ParE
MAFRIIRSRDSIKDLELVFDHLVETYISLGDSTADAVDRAVKRIRAIAADMETISKAPYQGTLHDRFANGLRSVTKNRAVFYFDIDEDAEVIRILAVFFGGQDHQRHMLKRLGRKKQPFGD